MPKIGDSGSGGSGAGAGVSLPSTGIVLNGPVEIVAQDGVVITAFPEQKRIQLTVGFADEARGDVMYRGASGWVRLPAGVAGQKLQTNGPGADPSWA